MCVKLDNEIREVVGVHLAQVGEGAFGREDVKHELCEADLELPGSVGRCTDGDVLDELAIPLQIDVGDGSQLGL